MTTEEFVVLNKKLGHQIISNNGFHWMKREDKSAISLPTLEVVYPKKSDFIYLFQQGIKIITFKTEIDSKNSFEYIFSGKRYEIELFESKIRNQIRKGLKTCNYRRPELNELIINAFEINNSTLSRQKRFVDYLGNKELWLKYITVMYNTKDVNILGAYYENKLVSYSLFIKINELYYIYHPFTDLEFSAYCPMNGIIYTFINEVIQKEGKITISYGLASYLEKPGLDKFKKGMLFEEMPVSRITVLHPIYRILFNNFINVILMNIYKIKRISVFEKINYFVNSKEILRDYYMCLKK